MKDFPPDFDPHLVPRWPRLTLEITGSGHPTVYKGHLGGRPIPLSEDVDTTDPYAVIEASVQHASTLIAERGWDTCRVSAVDPDGHVWPMILGSNGERHDLNESERTAHDTSRPTHPLHKLGLILAAAILVPALIVGGLLVGRHLSRPAPVAAGPYTPQIAELPVPAPAGWSTHAVWHVDNTDTDLAVVFDNAVWMISDGALLAVDPDTGQPRGRWQVGPSARGPWLTQVGGHPVVAAATTSTVVWVPSRTGGATSHPLPHGSQVTATTAGLWWVHENDAWVASTRPQRRTVPADAQIGAVEGTTLIATDRLGHLWRLNNDAIQTPAPLQLPRPRGASALDRVLGVGTQTVAIAWRPTEGTGGTVISFHTSTGDPVMAVTSDLSPTGQPDLDPRRPETIVVGQLVLDLERHTVAPLPHGLTLGTVVDGLGFGRRNDEAVTVDLATAHVLQHRATLSQPATPVAVSGHRLLVVDRQTIYCLEPA